MPTIKLAIVAIVFSVTSLLTVTCANAAAIQPNAEGNGTVTTDTVLSGLSFAQTCSSWGGTFGSIGGKGLAILQATCFTRSGDTRTTSLNLNDCIANDDGNLHCRVK